MKIRIVKKIMNNMIQHEHKVYAKYHSECYLNSVRRDFLDEAIKQKKHILNNPKTEIKPFMRFIKEYRDIIFNQPIYNKHNPYYIQYYIRDVFDICMTDDI